MSEQPCWQCAHHDPRHRKKPFWQWRCTFLARIQPVQNVVPMAWLAGDPHPACQDVNAYDQCRYFERLPNEQIDELETTLTGDTDV